MRPIAAPPAEILYNATQMFRLGLGRSAGVATHDLTAELLNAALLEELTMVCSAFALASYVKVGGQDVNCSNKGINVLMFHPEAQAEGVRSFGFPLHKAVEIALRITTAAPSTAVAGLGIQPVPPEILEQGIPDVNGLGDALSVVFGLGNLAIGAGATETLTATSKRKTTLGRVVIDSNTASSLYDAVITEIRKNGRPLLGGSGAIPLADVSYLATDIDGITLGQDVDVNDTIEFDIQNNGAGGITVYGGIWCMAPRGA